MVKQIIVVRKDLRIGIGKMISQACHACLNASEEARIRNRDLWKKWLNEGAKKIVVKVHSLEELLDLERQAKRLKLPHALIVDRGLTQLPPDTPTSIGIGPADDGIIDKITGKLRLL